MEFCAINWNELIKILTPFIIAFVVYRVWHNQKGKEVIASETKDFIKNVLEEATIVSLLQFETQSSTELISEKIERLNVVSQNIFRSSLYLDSCLKEPNLIELLKNYTEKSNRVYILLRNCANNHKDNPFVYKKMVRENNDDLNLYNKALEKLIIEITPYSTFQKRFKLKKFN